MMRALIVTCLLLASLGGLEEQADRNPTEGTRPSVIYISAGHKANRGPCDEERWLRITPAEAREHPRLIPGLIRCAARRWGVDVTTALQVARCESGPLYWPWAHSNGNYGTYQHRGVYWPARTERWLRPEWFNDAQWSAWRRCRAARTSPGRP